MSVQGMVIQERMRVHPKLLLDENEQKDVTQKDNSDGTGGNGLPSGLIWTDGIAEGYS